MLYAKNLLQLVFSTTKVYGKTDDEWTLLHNICVDTFFSALMTLSLTVLMKKDIKLLE